MKLFRTVFLLALVFSISFAVQPCAFEIFGWCVISELPAWLTGAKGYCSDDDPEDNLYILGNCTDQFGATHTDISR